MDEIKLLFLNLEQKQPLICQLVKHFDSVDGYSIAFSSGAVSPNAPEILADGEYAIVFFNVDDKLELESAAVFLNSFRAQVRKGIIRPVCFSQFENEKIEGFLQKLGCFDFLGSDEKNFKSAAFKIDLWRKKLLNRKAALAESEESQRVKDIGGVDSGDDSTSVKSNFIWQEPSISMESGKLGVLLRTEPFDGSVPDVECSLEDFFPDELVFTAPKGKLELNDFVQAKVTLSYGGKKQSVITEGIIVEVDSFDESSDCVSVSLTEVDKKKYAKFMELYMTRQKSINEFMKLAKGVA